MRDIPESQVLERIRTENPWWFRNVFPYDLRPRRYFDLFFPLVKDRSVRRAVLLMGPRRVGKTVLLHHAIQALIDGGVAPRRVCYLAVDHPLYHGRSLEELVRLFLNASGTNGEQEPAYVFFDEIQYLKDWEVHLKILVDGNPHFRFVASGSAAAALRLRSQESGAGRFTDFLLPPLTFHEYLHLLKQEDELFTFREGAKQISVIPRSYDTLNTAFLDYLNFGGYPEALFSEKIRQDPGRFIKGDIIDKVLLRDLPSLYGISDIQELNYLFTTIAFNTADEVSLDELSKNSGAAKNTIKKYIEYLEAAFLVRMIHRVDRTAKRFRRANFFKIYLTNSSIRSALFAPVGIEDDAMGRLAETAIFSQWFHAKRIDNLHYARWSGGEVDMVSLNPASQEIDWAAEVKWTDRFVDSPHELKSLKAFSKSNGLKSALVTTRTRHGHESSGNLDLRFIPAALYCYLVGRNVISGPREGVRFEVFGSNLLEGKLPI